jgi:hypothetical protein
VPASEPRAELNLVVDLPAQSDCEERFDLALYQDRGVELIRWELDAPGCQARSVKIRYLPRRLPEPALRERVARLARIRTSESR